MGNATWDAVCVLADEWWEGRTVDDAVDLASFLVSLGVLATNLTLFLYLLTHKGTFTGVLPYVQSGSLALCGMGIVKGYHLGIWLVHSLLHHLQRPSSCISVQLWEVCGFQMGIIWACQRIFFLSLLAQIGQRWGLATAAKLRHSSSGSSRRLARCARVANLLFSRSPLLSITILWVANLLPNPYTGAFLSVVVRRNETGVYLPRCASSTLKPDSESLRLALWLVLALLGAYVLRATRKACIRLLHHFAFGQAQMSLEERMEIRQSIAIMQMVRNVGVLVVSFVASLTILIIVLVIIARFTPATELPDGLKHFLATLFVFFPSVLIPILFLRQIRHYVHNGSPSFTIPSAQVLAIGTLDQRGIIVAPAAQHTFTGAHFRHNEDLPTLPQFNVSMANQSNLPYAVPIS